MVAHPIPFAPTEGGARMTASGFCSFQATRPDRERWELIDGAPVRLPRPTIAHQVLAGALARALDDAVRAVGFPRTPSRPWVSTLAWTAGGPVTTCPSRTSW